MCCAVQAFFFNAHVHAFFGALQRPVIISQGLTGARVPRPLRLPHVGAVDPRAKHGRWLSAKENLHRVNQIEI